MAVKIKLLAKFSSAHDHGYRPVPGWPGYEYSRSTSARDYDWLVVYDEMPQKSSGSVIRGKEPLECSPDHTILVTQEPGSVKSYGRAFVHQFGHYLTTREYELEEHPNYHLGRGYYWSYYGKKMQEAGSIDPLLKVKMISAVCSAKQMRHTCHSRRFQLISHLAGAVQGFDWFGRGVKPLGRKYEALDSYKYHVAVENHIQKGHCTEKLLDSILGECLTFYAGDPDVGTWLPPESFVPIPLDDFSEVERIVKSAIADNLFEKRIEAIKEAKRLILTKYNFWSQVIAVIESASKECLAHAPRNRSKFIVSRRNFRMNPMIAVRDAVCHLSRVFKNMA